MPGPAAPFVRRFDDLDRVVEEVHAVFDGWAEGDVTDDEAPAPTGLLVMKLAVHEWIANLVQHAAFGGRRPEIVLTVHPEPDGFRCVVEDNSDGFDFRGQVATQAAAARGAPTERGRGLLMLLACTEDLAYEAAAAGYQRLAFAIRLPVSPESLAALFPHDGCADNGADDDHPDRDAAPGLRAPAS